MGTGAEAVDPEPPTRRHGRTAQRAIADDARAEQRRGVDVGEVVREAVRIGLGHRGVLREASVGVPAGVLRVAAEVLPTGAAPLAPATGTPEPGDADPVTDREALGRGAA
jgi:hypothetical protein